MAEGAGLRWWQEETPAAPAYTAPVTTTPPVAAPPAATAHTTTDDTPLDVWDELEAEARARVVAENRGERIVIPYHNGYDEAWRRERLHQGRKILLIKLGVALMITAIQYALQHRIGGWGGGFFMANVMSYVEIHFRTRHLMTHQQVKPVVVLSPEGIAVHTYDVDIDLIRWNEIKDITATASEDGKKHWVQIVPKDAKALARRLGKRKVASPIRISQRCLPLTAEALVARIAMFEAGSK